MSSSDRSVVSDEERENDLERIVENAEPTEEKNSDNENKSNDEEAKEKRVVKPKRVIKNPRPKLNVEVLRGPKGLSCLENYFKNFKFKGNGHEAEDLRTIMKTYEYWCHRLFPKAPFDECLAKIEKLGTKNNMQTYLKRIRLGMDDFGISKPEISDDEEEQQEKASDGHNFDELTSQVKQADAEKPEEQLTEEQLEQIRINKERARQIRMARLRKLQEKANSLITDRTNPEGSSIQDMSQE